MHSGHRAGADDQHEHERERQAEIDQRQRQQTAGDDLVALGEIEDADGPVDEVEAEGHEGVDRPERDPFDGQCHVLHQAPPDSLVADRVTGR